MIDLAAAALAAGLVADAVGTFDILFRGWKDVVEKKEPDARHIPPPDFAYADDPEKRAIVARSRKSGAVYQSVTYEKLTERLSKGDREYIATLTNALEDYQRQWNLVFSQRPMAGGLELARLDSQLNYLAREIANVLLKVLAIVEKMGLRLDDHYLMARNVAAEYLAEDKSR
ncbi:MAG: hypothetical protein QOG72_1679 [Sphingomonadales bacterium]|jgi:hypothetical protein|nr:hypothetical protein [Sphingomonadales bacterium]